MLSLASAQTFRTISILKYIKKTFQSTLNQKLKKSKITKPDFFQPLGLGKEKK